MPGGLTSSLRELLGWLSQEASPGNEEMSYNDAIQWDLNVSHTGNLQYPSSHVKKVKETCEINSDMHFI